MNKLDRLFVDSPQLTGHVSMGMSRGPMMLTHSHAFTKVVVPDYAWFYLSLLLLSALIAS